MPVFVINGFLEAGKTQFITNTLQQDYFQADGTTVLILCEEGDTEYDKLKLDLTYIENYSVWLDLKLMLLTLKVLFLVSNFFCIIINSSHLIKQIN